MLPYSGMACARARRDLPTADSGGYPPCLPWQAGTLLCELYSAWPACTGLYLPPLVRLFSAATCASTGFCRPAHSSLRLPTHSLRAARFTSTSTVPRPTPATRLTEWKPSPSTASLMTRGVLLVLLFFSCPTSSSLSSRRHFPPVVNAASFFSLPVACRLFCLLSTAFLSVLAICSAFFHCIVMQVDF